MNKKLTYLLVALFAGLISYWAVNKHPVQNSNAQHQAQTQAVLGQSQSELKQDSDYGVRTIAEAYAQHKSNVLVQASGQVKAVLRDDNQGTRHQKFILALGNGQTLLIAHNIDLAPRLEGLKKGDIVAFKGEYEYSPQGGVVHWTHKDPRQTHDDGWLKYKGRIYQ